MPVQYPNTPGVKVVEESLLAPSIAQISTAVPVFIGYTKKGTLKEAVRITSLKEYENEFGGSFPHDFKLNSSLEVDSSYTKTLDYILYESIQLYFLNGGRVCYILPVGNFPVDTTTGILKNESNITKADFINAMPIIETLDEPTLIAFPEAVKFNTQKYGEIAVEALKTSHNTKDKFALIDQSYESDLLNFNPASNALGAEAFRTALGTEYLSYGAVYYPSLAVSIDFTINEEKSVVGTDTLKKLKTDRDTNYEKAILAIHKEKKMYIPPSSLIAGVYAKNDREYGFWKAPANISLQGVIKPKKAISDATQQKLNVDATGKSINAIRQFTGKGTIVWGARTLDGNSNEWRYISVRRLFMTVEESIKKATAQFVFENNDTKTWVKVNAMISAYLNELWKQGALMGASAKEAYFVRVGLGTTMTQQNILDGQMIIQIGLAAVRPAEFIILSFSHKMQEL
ncbi:phage tail sheath family protein [Aquimarina longa]|uniref:phage tail sheath family protein n=1 Tax=Aquimarina longa TaxID=1080221 RepID=UPI000785DD1D|nr:phage tail sheath C-terminal domain-containing protein [Aquimarina longa]